MPTPYFLMAMFLSFTRETALIFVIGGEIKVVCLFVEITSTFILYWNIFTFIVFLKIMGLQMIFRAFNKQSF